MKKFLFIALILLSFSCKKDNASENITDYHWFLKAQSVSPAITIGGKTSTDYLSLQNPSGCTRNFAFTFFKNGVFATSSNGPLCDMLANSNSQKWNLVGDQLTIDYGLGQGSSSTLLLKENTLTLNATITVNGADYDLTSTYIAEKK